MKKFICIGMILIMCVSLVSCKKEEPVPETVPTVTEEVASAEETTSKETESALDLSRIKLPDFKFADENFPKMDGSTSCVPLGKAIAALLLGINEDEAGAYIDFHKTTQSFRNLAAGESDILIVGEPNAAVFKEMEEDGFEYELKEFASDALIFVVNEDNPVDNLTTDQIRDIYSGKITNWKEVGGNDAEIIPFQRNEGAGSQALMLKLVMKDTQMTEAPVEYVAGEMGDLMEAVKSYDNSANAIGYSVYYYANDMRMADGLKILSVDGVAPSDETIRAREYPHLNAYYTVIPESAKADSPARVIFDWLMTEDGQTLIASKGYVSAIDTGIKAEASAFPEKVYTLLDGDLNELHTRDDYGSLYPYTGNIQYVNSGDGYAYRGGSTYGFFDEKGRIVTEPVYSDIFALVYYDTLKNSETSLGVYAMTKNKGIVKEDEYIYADKTYRMVTADGSFISDEYEIVFGSENCVIGLNREGEYGFTVFDLKGNVMMDQDIIIRNNPEFKDRFNKYLSVDYIDEVYRVWFDEFYYCFDKDGKQIGGPYGSVGRVINDMILVTMADDERTPVLVDDKGNAVAQFDSYGAYRLCNGNVISGDGAYWYLYDECGNVLGEYESNEAWPTHSGFMTSVFPPYESKEEGAYFPPVYRFYDCDGKLLYENEDDVVDYNADSDIVYYGVYKTENDRSQYDPDGVQLIDIVRDKQLYIDGAEYAYPFYTLDGVASLNYMVANRYTDDGNKAWLIDTDRMKIVETIEGNYSCVRDDILGDWYIIKSTDDYKKHVLYDNRLNEIIELDDFPQINNRRIIINNDYSTTCMEMDGNVIFRYNLIDSADD